MVEGGSRDLIPVQSSVGYIGRGRNIVTVIGIDNYVNWPKLHNAVSDAEGIRKLFVEKLGFLSPIPPLLNSDATQKKLTSLVQDQLYNVLKPDDALVIFFAGHGHTRLHQIPGKTTETGYIIPVEAQIDQWSDYIKIDSFLEDISQLPARHILVILDACHSGFALGNAMKKYRSAVTYKKDLLNHVSRKIITSARRDEVALDGGPIEGHSLFTGTLVHGLDCRKADLDGDGLVTSSELGLYLQQRVGQASASEQTPDFGCFYFDDRGEMVISLPVEIVVPAPNKIVIPPRNKMLISPRDDQKFEEVQGLDFLPLHKLGAREDKQNPKVINFGLFLPGISAEEGYRLKVRIIHEKDRFLHDISPFDFEMEHSEEFEYGDYWSAAVNIESRDKSKPYSVWGTPGKYVYRYCLERPNKKDPIDWIIDPFAREFGDDKLSAFILGYEPYEWSENEHLWKTPSLNDIILYELMITEFADDIDGTIDHLEYLTDLGVNCIELMPLSKGEKKVDWGYMPAGYFGVDNRFGNRKDMQRLVNAAHQKGIAVIVDSVYGHTSFLFPYYYVYNELGWPMDKNPFMGPFADNSFGISTNFNQKFTRDFFLTVNHYWLDTYHIDGFRYDYVPGYWLENSENGYTKLVQDTYQLVKAKMGSPDHWQRFFKEDSLNFIQCAEQLRDPVKILNKTYSNCTWQNETLSAAMGVARNSNQLTNLGFFFGLHGYPEEVQHNGDKIMKTALQYLENHDHSRFICNFGTTARDNELLKEGDRSLWYKVQPYLIGLFTARGIPMLWQGQEFGENYFLPQEGEGRIVMYRPVHWEYLNTSEGRSLFQLVRKLIKLRKNNLQFTRGEYHFYDDYNLYQSRNIMLFSKLFKGLFSLVALNFGAQDQVVPFRFPFSGNYREELHGMENLMDILADREVQLRIPSYYGRIWTLET